MDAARVKRSAASDLRVTADISADSESLILVDEATAQVGQHEQGPVPRGPRTAAPGFFGSDFQRAGELLLQQRAQSKRLWPLYWSNSCCSHPRRGETMQSAVHRRLYEELGCDGPLAFPVQVRVSGAIRCGRGRARAVLRVHRAPAPGRFRINRGEISRPHAGSSPQALQGRMAGRGSTSFIRGSCWMASAFGTKHRAAVLTLQSPPL